MLNDLSEVKKYVRVWKKRLNLEDWTIRTRFSRDGEKGPDDKECWAWIHPSVDRGVADLVIDAGIKNEEFWVLHELSHIVLGGMLKEGYPDFLEERAIQRFNIALARAYGVKIPLDFTGYR